MLAWENEQKPVVDDTGACSQAVACLIAAVAEAIMKFNAGNAKTVVAILTELSVNPSAQTEKLTISTQACM